MTVSLLTHTLPYLLDCLIADLLELLIYLSAYLLTHTSACLLACLLYLLVCLLAYKLAYLPTCLLTCLLICLPTYLLACLLVCMSAYLLACLPACLLACLFYLKSLSERSVCLRDCINPPGGVDELTALTPLEVLVLLGEGSLRCCSYYR